MNNFYENKVLYPSDFDEYIQMLDFSMELNCQLINSGSRFIHDKTFRENLIQAGDYINEAIYRLDHIEE